MRRTWTPRDPEPDALAVADNYGVIFIRRDVALDDDAVSAVWFMPSDPAVEFTWPEQWDGYGGDYDVVISELDITELDELVPDGDR